MDNAVSEVSPAGADAVAGWIRTKGEGTLGFVFGDRNLDIEQTIALANEGLATSNLKNNAFEGLSAGFSRNDCRSTGRAIGLDNELSDSV